MGTRALVASRIEIKPECYGKYNRKVLAWTDEGLIDGIVPEGDTGGLDIGTHHGERLIRIYETLYGTKLVEAVLRGVWETGAREAQRSEAE